MPNVLDLEPVRAFARRAAGKIADERVAARFERLAVARLLEDPYNFRAATDAELDTAPEWARLARDRGDTMCVFKLQRGAAQRLHNFARRLDATLRLAALDIEARPHSATFVNAARAFLDKLERADFETTRRKAYHFARMLGYCSDMRDAKRVCPEEIVPASDGRRWLRITSVAELRAIGREFRNCLARTTRTSVYGGGLFRGERQFWVLRDAADKGRIVAMADAPFATRLMEVRTPGNGRVSTRDPDLAQLARAIGIRAPPPPPPPTQPPAAAVRLPRPACRCLRCALPPPALRLFVAAP